MAFHVLLFILAFQTHGARATKAVIYNVAPSGDDRTVLQAGGTAAAAAAPSAAAGKIAPPTAATGVVYNLSRALEMARAGDTILLGDGDYHDRVVSSRNGVNGNPITIVGGVNAVIRAARDSVEINHSWITIQVSEQTTKCATGLPTSLCKQTPVNVASTCKRGHAFPVEKSGGARGACQRMASDMTYYARGRARKKVFTTRLSEFRGNTNSFRMHRTGSSNGRYESWPSVFFFLGNGYHFLFECRTPTVCA